jgi:hypothetical protein
VIEIGRRLTECKEIVGHGYWLSWLDRLVPQRQRLAAVS